ncbi:MAG: urease accessory protein UreF [Roseinatronobacter sp.]
MRSPDALTLLHWLSPVFPTGAFAYSHGLEQVIALGDVRCDASLERWLGDILRFGAGWQDAVLLSLALRDEADLDALDAFAVALQPSAERLLEAREQGAAFARVVGQITGRALQPRLLPIAVADAARGLRVPPEDVIGAFLQAFLTNLVTIAIRHVPLGQGAGHAVLSRLLAQVPVLAQDASVARAEDLGNSCLAADLAAMEHETRDVRLFRT